MRQSDSGPPRSLIPLLLVLVLVTASESQACGVCGSIDGEALSLPHPRAIEIAVATRAAVEKGLFSDRPDIPRASVSSGSRGLISLDKVPGPLLVKCWAARINLPKPEVQPVAAHFVFIDTQQSCGLMVRSGTAVFESKPSFHADALIVTTRAAFQALVDGAITVAEAQQSGLLLIEGDAATSALLPGQSR